MAVKYSQLYGDKRCMMENWYQYLAPDPKLLKIIVCNSHTYQIHL